MQDMRSVKIRVLQFSTTTLLLGGLFGCGHVAQSGLGLFNNRSVPITSISDLQQSYEGNPTVYLEGKVASQAPFVGSGAYELRDATGKIWVFTSQSLPDRGDEVLIKGKVQYQSIPFAGKDLGEVFLQQQEQLERKPAKKGVPLLPEGSYEQ
ncbi:hypothetical protein NDI44_20130 [Trichocoleus sp. DQ-A3]|jgi:hypothetical protein|uniref:hypothetical protein n=2 Tax=Cyanobacteriota TaxID=1117 RepID=UPI001F55853E|nr:hypothetical protein [Coleofasciculus sp. FACHB-125]